MEHDSRELAIWSITMDDERFIQTKQQSAWLDYAIKLLSYRASGIFAKYNDIDHATLNYLADQLYLPERLLKAPNHGHQTNRNRQKEILKHLGVRKFVPADKDLLSNIVAGDQRLENLDREDLEAWIAQWAVDRKVSMPTKRQIDRLHGSLRNRINLAAFNRVYHGLSLESRKAILASIDGKGTSLVDIKKSPGQVGRPSFNKLAAKVKFIQSLDLPGFLMTDYSKQWRKEIVRTVKKKDPWEIRRMPEVNRIGMYAVYLKHNEAAFTDELISMLISSVHKIHRNSFNKVTGALKTNARKEYDKQAILKGLIEEVLARPDDRAMDVLLSVIKENDIDPLLAVLKGKDGFNKDVFERMKSKWSGYYRSMVKTLLETLEFHSNNKTYQPVIEALDWIHVNLGQTRNFHVERDDVPITGVIKKSDRPVVIGPGKILDKPAYELCVLLELRDRLRCREIWVPGSGRYRNPSEDMPKDFDLNRVEYYRSLGLSTDAREFVEKLKLEMEEGLLALNHEFPRNPSVNIEYKPKHEKFQFVITPFPPSPEPPNLALIKSDVNGGAIFVQCSGSILRSRAA